MNAYITPPKNNCLLAQLPREYYEELRPCFAYEHIHQKRPIFERGKPIEDVYFPCDSVFSFLNFMKNGAVVEVGTAGYEGFVGTDLLIGSNVALESCVCQVEGESLRMSASDFNQATAVNTPLRQVAQRYLQAYLSQVAQSVACNRLHTIEERFARWILMTHDRVRRDEFHLTQEFIADMLGAQRPSVSLIASAFQQAGLIRYSRGQMTILDRSGLEQISCECYAAVRKHFDKFMGRAIG